MRPSTTRLGVAVAVVATLLAGCDQSDPARARPFEDVEALYEAAGGEDWCGAELVVTFAPAAGRCGDPTAEGERTVVLGAGFLDRGQLVDSISSAADSGLPVLVTSDVDSGDPWFQLRSADVAALEEARAELGGDLLESPVDFESWVGRNDE